MRLGRVIGTVIATAKDQQLKGHTIRIVELIDVHGQSSKAYEVAVDTVCAEKGNVVLLVSSSSARMTRQTENKPVDNAIVAIVDQIEMDGKVMYSGDGF